MRGLYMDEFKERLQRYIDAKAISMALIGAAIGNALGYAVETGRCPNIDQRPDTVGFMEHELDGESGRATLSGDFREMLSVLEALIEAEGGEGDAAKMDAAVFIRRGLERVQSPRSDRPDSGCMLRMIPIGLISSPYGKSNDTAELGMRAAAITHSHPKSMRYAAAFAHILDQCVKGRRNLAGLRGYLWICADDMKKLFGSRWAMNTKRMQMMLDGMYRDCTPAAEAKLNPGPRNALYLSLACCTRHPLNFTRAITQAARYGGTVGAMAGCIWVLQNKILTVDAAWLEKLEMADEIAELAEKLYHRAERMRARPEAGKDDAALNIQETKEMGNDE